MSDSSTPVSAPRSRIRGPLANSSRQGLRAATALIVAAALTWPAAAAQAAADAPSPAEDEVVAVAPATPDPAATVTPDAPEPDPTTPAAAPPAADDTSLAPEHSQDPAPASTSEPAPTPAPTADRTAGAVDGAVEAAAVTATLSGRVLDSTGAPLAGVEVHVGDVVPADGVPLTAADGTWTLTEVPARTYRVMFRMVDGSGTYPVYWNGTTYGTYSSSGPAVTVGAGESRDGLDVTYIENTVTGTVTGGGAPVAGATVSLHARRTSSALAQTVRTDADGTWTARWLLPDYYLVRVVPPEGSGLAEAWWGHHGNSYYVVDFDDSTPRTEQGVDVDLPVESRLGGRVVDLAGRPVAGTRVALWTRDGFAAYATTAADGTYQFLRLGEGDYAVQVAHPSPSVVPAYLGGGLDRRHAVWTHVGAVQHVGVGDLVQQEGGAIYGEVVGTNVGHIGAIVELVAPDGSVVLSMWSEAVSDDVASFGTLGAVPPGSYRVRATISGVERWWAGGNSLGTARVLEVRPGADIDDVEIFVDIAHREAPPAPAVEELTDGQRGTVSTTPTAAPGAAVTISGLEPGALVYVWLASTPVGLGYLDVAADGTVQVTVPAGTAPGAHRFVVTSTTGAVLGWTDLTVVTAAAVPGASGTPGAPRAAATPRARLAATGLESAGVAGVALAAILVGGGLVWIRRRSATEL